MPSIMELQLTTELDAVNAMLHAIGESPVNTVNDNGVVDAVTARQTLQMTSRRIQSQGWSWNTDLSMTLSRSFPEGEVKIASNTLRVIPRGPSSRLKLTIRGTRLYNRLTHSYEFEAPVVADVVSFLRFEDLPEHARQFITIAAARKFQEGHVGSETLSGFTRRDELLAWSNLMDAETQEADYNMLTGDPTVTRMLDRDWG